MDFGSARDYILRKLEEELPLQLYYHSCDHTKDVYEATCRLISMEGTGEDRAVILKTAALYHDAGMLVQYAGHEEASVAIARETLPAFGYSAREVDEVTALIMATKLPQTPSGYEAQILCDADLDYLGREDYGINAMKLRAEWRVNNIRNTTLSEWYAIQVQFLTNHTYFTKSARALRNELKMYHLDEIIALLKKD